ncbi:MAG: CvpA family protein [Candidatus Neomarinimicrobiota bacterium]|nr:MAG: CvpA family protein [Candidatus Neomarinimicrobiota bacterium]
MPVSVIDLITVLVMAGTGYLGYHKGALAELSQLGSLVIALFLSLFFSQPLTTWLLLRLPLSPAGAMAGVLLLLFTGWYLCFRLFFRVLEYLADGQRARRLDRLLGAVLGAGKAALFIAVSILILDTGSGHRWVRILRQDSVVVETIYQTQIKLVQALRLIPESREKGMEI